MWVSRYRVCCWLVVAQGQMVVTSRPGSGVGDPGAGTDVVK